MKTQTKSFTSLPLSLYCMLTFLFYFNVIQAQVIITQPQNDTTCAGNGTTFSVSAIGTGKLSYRWKMNGLLMANTTIFSGVDSSVLTITDVTGLNIDSFNCIVTDTTGTITSNAGYITVISAPSIIIQPTSTTICVGSNLTFTVAALGTGLTYQWQENSGTGFVNITNSSVYSGTNSDSFSITTAPSSLSGNLYRCLITGSCTLSVQSDSVLLVVKNAPLIISQPTSNAICAGSNSLFSISVSGTGLAYQWQENSGAGFVNLSNSSVYSGVNSDSFSIVSVPSLFGGNRYRCLVTGNCTLSVQSDSVILVIKAAPSIITQPISSLVCAGSSTTFTVAASGSGISYQWQENSGAGFVNLSNSSFYSGTNTNTFSISSVPLTFGGNTYKCLISGSCSPFIFSNSVSLTVNSSPIIIRQPNSSIICEGSNAIFKVLAYGTGITYQWQENSGTGFINLLDDSTYSGSTNDSLVISSSSALLSGNSYRCVITGVCLPSITSDSVNLIVNTPGTWLGTINNDWGTAENWGCANVPTFVDDAFINSNYLNIPIISDHQFVKNLTINNGAILILNPSSKLTILGTFTNDGLLSDTNATVEFSGSSTQPVSGGTYGNLEINNFSGVYINGNVTILDSLKFIKGCITLNANNLIVASNGTLSKYDDTNFVITNDVGLLKIQNIGSSGINGSVVFPVGTSVSSYSPAILKNSGTTDAYGVRVIPQLSSTYDNAGTPIGTAITNNAVNRTWILNENAIGGTNATITLQWNGADELPNFNRNNSFVSQYNNSIWISDSGYSANGSNPYQQSISGVTSLSPLSVQSISSTGIISVNNISSIDFSVHPNPFSNLLSVNIKSFESEIIKIQIEDLNGRLICNQTIKVNIGNNHADITNVDQLKDGIYIMRITDNNETYIKKLIKQN